jgi:hypothetical protein
MTILTSKQTWRRNPVPSGRTIALRLTPQERDNVREALLYFCGRYATVESCISTLDITKDARWKARSHRVPTYRFACTLARAAGVPVEKILSGLWPGDRCPHCGGTGKRSQIVRGPK